MTKSNNNNNNNGDEIDVNSKEVAMFVVIGNLIGSLIEKYLHTWNDLTDSERENIVVKCGIMIATIVREKDDTSEKDDPKLYAARPNSLDLEPTNSRKESRN